MKTIMPICGLCGTQPRELDGMVQCVKDGCDNYRIQHTPHAWGSRFKIGSRIDPELVLALARAVEVLAQAKQDTTQAVMALRGALAGDVVNDNGMGIR